MRPKSVRTSIDLPRDLHRRLHEAAARKGCSARQLMLAAIEQAIVSPQRRRRRLILDRPLLAGRRKPISITNDEIYELGFP
ncbi:MAG TPA: hypothetical protein VEV17_23110 [Bryobacteraceae bacterium]|nr:hypothetical protein [Bryobacteraceae bacterium]